MRDAGDYLTRRGVAHVEELLIACRDLAPVNEEAVGNNPDIRALEFGYRHDLSLVLGGGSGLDHGPFQGSDQALLAGTDVVLELGHGGLRVARLDRVDDGSV